MQIKRVGFVGWRGMVGSVLVQRMREEKDFDDIEEPVFLSTSQINQPGPDLGKGSAPLADATDINFLNSKKDDLLFKEYPDIIKSLQWHSYEVQNLENNNDITLLASSPETKYQIFKYKKHAYGIQFHIEIKDTTVGEWGCVPEYKSALESQLGQGALKKFDSDAKDNIQSMNKYSKILYENFKKIVN